MFHEQGVDGVIASVLVFVYLVNLEARFVFVHRVSGTIVCVSCRGAT